MRGHVPAGTPEEPGPQPTISQGQPVPAPFVWEQLTPEQQREFDRRKASRAVATAIVLGALVVLIFALSIAKIHAGWRP